MGSRARRWRSSPRAAGLPKANLHYYFGTKERLYRAVLEGILALWLDDAAAWIVPENHPAAGLAGYVRAKMAHSRLRPHASRIFAGELLRGAPRIMLYLGLELRRRVAELAAVIQGWSRRRPHGPDRSRSTCCSISGR